MTYIVSWKFGPATYKEAMSRFLSTGAPPPEGVTMHSRWHGLSTGRGCLVASTDDPAGIFEWVASWSDLLELEVLPVIEDAAAAAVLQKINQ
jgi:hypothetical protein